MEALNLYKLYIVMRDSVNNEETQNNKEIKETMTDFKQQQQIERKRERNNM